MSNASPTPLLTPGKIAAYYDHPDTEWFGRAAKLLGLLGHVMTETLKRVMKGEHPLTRDPLRKSIRTVFAVDVTYGAPKSVSLVAMFDERIHKVLVEVMKKAEAYAEGEIMARDRRGALVKTNLSRITGNTVGIRCIECFSRENDPQLHGHDVYLNLTKDESRDRWLAADMSGLFKRQALFRQAMHADLAAGIWGLGYDVVPTADGLATAFEIAGVPGSLREEYSKRSKRIGAKQREIEEGLVHGDGAVARIELRALENLIRKKAKFSTRPAKSDDPEDRLRANFLKDLSPGNREILEQVVAAARGREAQRTRPPVAAILDRALGLLAKQAKAGSEWRFDFDGICLRLLAMGAGGILLKDLFDRFGRHGEKAEAIGDFRRIEDGGWSHKETVCELIEIGDRLRQRRYECSDASALPGPPWDARESKERLQFALTQGFGSGGCVVLRLVPGARAGTDAANLNACALSVLGAMARLGADFNVIAGAETVLKGFTAGKSLVRAPDNTAIGSFVNGPAGPLVFGTADQMRPDELLEVLRGSPTRRIVLLDENKNEKNNLIRYVCEQFGVHGFWPFRRKRRELDELEIAQKKLVEQRAIETRDSLEAAARAAAFSAVQARRARQSVLVAASTVEEAAEFTQRIRKALSEECLLRPIRGGPQTIRTVAPLADCLASLLENPEKLKDCRYLQASRALAGIRRGARFRILDLATNDAVEAEALGSSGKRQKFGRDSFVHLRPFKDAELEIMRGDQLRLLVPFLSLEGEQLTWRRNLRVKDVGPSGINLGGVPLPLDWLPLDYNYAVSLDSEDLARMPLASLLFAYLSNKFHKRLLAPLKELCSRCERVAFHVNECDSDMQREVYKLAKWEPPKIEIPGFPFEAGAREPGPEAHTPPVDPGRARPPKSDPSGRDEIG